MLKKLLTVSLILFISGLSTNAHANGSGLTIEDVFYCHEDFSMRMSNGERWVVRKSDVGEQKLDHVISIAMFMIASDKKTGNVFPGQAITWCGMSNVKPITIISFVND